MNCIGLDRVLLIRKDMMDYIREFYTETGKYAKFTMWFESRKYKYNLISNQPIQIKNLIEMFDESYRDINFI